MRAPARLHSSNKVWCAGHARTQEYLNCSFSWGVREERLQPGEAKVGETEACRPSEREREKLRKRKKSTVEEGWLEGGRLALFPFWMVRCSKQRLYWWGGGVALLPLPLIQSWTADHH